MYSRWTRSNSSSRPIALRPWQGPTARKRIVSYRIFCRTRALNSSLIIQVRKEEASTIARLSSRRRVAPVSAPSHSSPPCSPARVTALLRRRTGNQPAVGRLNAWFAICAHLLDIICGCAGTQSNSSRTRPAPATTLSKPLAVCRNSVLHHRRGTHVELPLQFVSSHSRFTELRGLRKLGETRPSFLERGPRSVRRE